MSDQNKPPEEDWGPREPWQPGPGQPGQQPFPPQQQGPHGQQQGPQQGPQQGQQPGPQPGQQPWPQPGQQPWPQAGPPPGPGWQGQPAGGPGYVPVHQQSNTAQTMAIIGIVCIVFCAPAAIVLGLMAQNKFREQHQPDTLAKIAWIGGIVSIVIGFLYLIGSGA